MADEQTLSARLRSLVDELVHRGVTLEQGRQEFEKQYILSSLRSNDGSIGRSAQCLGVHRNTLRNKVERLGIDLRECGARRSMRQAAAKT